MSLKQLKDEITNDPLGRGYSGMDHNQVAASLNAVDRTKVRPIVMTELREWAASDARAFNVNQGITNVALTDQQRNLCLVADKLLSTDDGNLDPGNAVHVALVNQLVDAGVLSADDRTALVSKATDNISRATELGLGTVRSGHVEIVRK